MKISSPSLLLSLFTFFLLGCSVPVAGAIDEGEANRVVVALDRAGLDATKEVDPAAEGKWRVSVARDDVPRALSTMRDEELPRVRAPGVLDAVGKGSLVPSEATEHAQLVAGMAGDLERTLGEIDGVLEARVHLNVPAPSPLRDTAPTHGSASVLLEHRGATPPISADAVQRLVSGGVAGLSPSDVTVVMLSRSAPPAVAGGTELAHVGPIAVARGSARGLQIALGVLLALVALLAVTALTLYTRLGRSRAELLAAATAAAKPSSPRA